MPRLRARAPPAPLTAPSVAPTASSTRPRRGTANQPPAAAVIQRSSPEESRQSIRLTVKSSPGRLRDATSGPIPKTGVSRQNIVSGKRASRSSRVVREVDSEEDEDDDEEEDEADEVDAMDVDDDEEDEDEDAEGDDDEDMDAEGEEDDDVDDDTPVPRPVIPTARSVPVKPAISITRAQDSVEATEMAMDGSDDDELSDPDSDLDGEDEDAEGEDEDAEGEEDDEIGGLSRDVDDMDTDEDVSRDQTPDVTKMTKRQRAIINEDSDGALMALSNEAQKKKHLTAEEHAMRRAEMARRRKNLSEKRNEEEKLDTINRLLKKQPPKRGRRAIQDITESGQEEEPEVERANPLFVRYIQNAKGTQLGVPGEWLQTPVGKIFSGAIEGPTKTPLVGRMVEEVA
ncbi:hypothetical protein IQ07DRAFT_587862 [Pyrenochaeta sp. DS3sAY3a]|nr:hypothetical protein IQ07DRAFT_587862 [Pyrenochaeta sp. DS3sAY3a]